MHSSNFKDITGQRFGRLTVISCAGRNKRNRSLWNCVCQCGKHVVARSDSLKSGDKQSCGCLNSDNKSLWCKNRNTTHGLSDTRLYNVWVNMRRRCNDESCAEYKNYGGRGIRVCEEWENNFLLFHEWAMDNGYDPTAKKGECTIDRIDVNGNYCPQNCRFTDNMTQASNKRNNKLITHNGVTRTQSEWARVYKKNRAFFCGSDDLIERRMNGCDAYIKVHGHVKMPPYTRCAQRKSKAI